MDSRRTPSVIFLSKHCLPKRAPKAAGSFDRRPVGESQNSALSRTPWAGKALKTQWSRIADSKTSALSHRFIKVYVLLPYSL
jgi:hypothetical protein